MDIRQIIDLPGTANAQRDSFWSGDLDGLANSDWDATWIFPDVCFTHLPSRNHARQHEDFSSPSSSPEPQGGNTRAQNGIVDVDMPCPSVTLPRPSLDFDFRIGVVFDSTPLAEMGRWKAAISGGSWMASFGAGTVVPGGHDLGQEGVGASFKLRTNDEPPAMLDFYSRGGTPSTTVGGSCRMVINITSEDQRYAKAVNLSMWIGAGAWKGRELVIDAYRVG